MRLFLHVFCRALLIFSLLTGLSLSSVAQDEENAPRRGSRVIDDTTRQVYGPNTSKYYYEKDVFYNREIYYPIDTAIRNFHRWNYVQRNNNLYQDLGNIGTAIRPIYYQSPDVIGVSSGFHVYDVYWDADQVKYYDTKSPYTNMKVDLGGKGRSLTRASFSRNINPRWNFGFTYRGMFVDKQIQRDGKGDRNMKANYYDLYTAFQSKDSTYRLFFNLRRNYHRVFENGGVQVSDGYSYDDFFLDNIRPWLTDAETNELRTNYHLYHQYKIGKALQLYHQFDRSRQGNRFIDSYSLEPSQYFDYIEIDSADSYDYAKFKSVRNEAGIKGSLGKLFYNGYVALRHYSMTYNRLSTDTLRVQTKGDESYLGGRISLKLDSLVEVNGWGEILQTGNYRLQGEIKSKWFEASLQQMQYAPGFMMQAYRGAHDVWNNDFDDIESTRINGYLHYNSKWLSLSPGITFTRIRNYTFFNYSNPEELEEFQTVLPVQSSGNQIFASPEIRVAVRFLRHIELSGQGIFNSFIENADDAIRLPRAFVNGQISYANIFFHGNLDMHAGVDVHWKSAYKAPAYDPVIQQFYNQDSFTNPDFPVIDIFFNAKIKRGRIYVKYNNLVNAITRSGYLPTPFYPGQRSVLDFGFDWSFYD